MHIKATKIPPEEVGIPEIKCPDCEWTIKSLQFLVYDSGTGICPSCNTPLQMEKGKR